MPIKKQAWGRYAIFRHMEKKFGFSFDDFNKLVLATVYAESRFNPKAVSPKGARGLMQIIAPTWEATVQRLAREGVIPEAWPYEPDVFDPRKNVTVGVSYLAEVMEKMSRRYPKATLKELLQYSLAGYNAGPDHSDSYYPKVVNGQISGNHETPDYVRKIIAMYKNIDKDKLGRLFVQDKAAGYTEYLSGTGEFSVAERKMAAEGKRPVAPADVPPEAGYKLPIEERVRLTRKESGKEVIFPVVETLMAEGKALRSPASPA